MLMIKTLSNVSGHLNSDPLPLTITFFIKSIFGHYYLSTCSYIIILVILFCHLHMEFFFKPCSLRVSCFEEI